MQATGGRWVMYCGQLKCFSPPAMIIALTDVDDGHDGLALPDHPLCRAFIFFSVSHGYEPCARGRLLSGGR